MSKIDNFTVQESFAFNAEAEQQALGAALVRPDSVSVIQAAGGPDLFFDPVHREIFEEMARRDKRSEFISPVSMKVWGDGLPGLVELGGPAYLARLAGNSISANALADYCSLLRDLFDKRQLITSLREASDSLIQGEEPTSVVAGRLEHSLSGLEVASGPEPVSMMAATHKALEQAIAAREGDDADRVQTGIDAVDSLMSGLYPGEMILLGGRPSMGKTSVALNIALNAARAGHGVVICSLEMNPEAMAVRAISESTGRLGRAVTYRDIRQGSFNDTQMQAIAEGAKEVAELPISFLSREFSDLGALLAGARQAKKRLGGNFKLLVIDYTQLLKSNARGRYEQITEISIALKNLAGQMNVPVLALSQLSRAIEQREDKRPVMSDLRESGQLEQDADAVMFCYRDEYYLEREKPEMDNPDAFDAWSSALERSRNRLEIIIAKQRQGPVGTANVMCNVALNRIWER